jgi:fucose permease
MNQNQNKLTALPIFFAFLCMGFGDVVGPLTGLVKEEYQLSNFMALLVPAMGFIMFGLISVPMGVFQDIRGKKFTLLLGLILALIGLILLIMGKFSTFELLLLSILMLGAGATILQVAGNPIMRDVSPEGKYSRNLSLGQFVKAIGSLSGALIPVLAANYWGLDWKILFPIYSAILLLTIIITLMFKIHEHKDPDSQPASFGSSLSLLRIPYVAAMVFGIFLYVGAEVCMSSGLPMYLESEFGINIEKLGVAGTGLFFLTLMAGRFMGGIILNWIKPNQFLSITVIISILGILGLFLNSQAAAIVSIIFIGLGFANVFPLIFSITVDRMPHRSNELSGLMVTAIVGGAFVPLLMGVLADNTSVMLGFLVPLACIIYIGYVALINKRSIKTQPEI